MPAEERVALEGIDFTRLREDFDDALADAQAMLGFVQFGSDHTPDAIRSWKRSLKLRPDATVSQYLARAERESSAESDFSQHESSHFNLHFEGKQTSEGFRRDLMAALEAKGLVSSDAEIAMVPKKLTLSWGVGHKWASTSSWIRWPPARISAMARP